MSSTRNPPSTQTISSWVIDSATSDYERLYDVCVRALSKQLKDWSSDEIADLADKEVWSYLPEVLRNERAKRKDDGGTCTFEIDNESPPYIKRAEDVLFQLASRIRAMDWKQFEVLCSEILKKIGGKAQVTGQPSDGGVDFYAIEIQSHAMNLPLPRNASLNVIGQAKKYSKDLVNESEVRKFVGGAVLKLEELRREQQLGLLSPTLFAFWTSSDLHYNAKVYAKSMGIWYMDGLTLANYVQKLGLHSQVGVRSV